MTEHGIEAGKVCGRNGCEGVIEEKSSEGGCSCHISPPCGHCTTPREYCPECEWDAEEELVAYEREYLARMRPISPAPPQVPPKERPLDPTKIDYRTEARFSASETKKGVYPPGTTMTQVEAIVRGSWGGKFEHFGDGRFTYTAYTD